MLIGFRSLGGLGNQMFIYAVSVAQSKNYLFGSCISQLLKLKYFNLSLSDYLFNSIKWYWLMLKRKTFGISELEFTDGWKEYKDQLKKLSYPCIIRGYFQNISYFDEVLDIVKSRFQIRKSYINEFEDVFSNFKDKKIVAVHFRRTDYQTFKDDSLKGPNLCLPLSYYRGIINELEDDKYFFILIGDDHEFIKSNFESKGNYYFSNFSEIIDFQILMNAHICVVSNSSFAWWGTYLNDRKDKVVYVPEHFLGFKVGKEYPVNIIPAGWKKVKV